MKKNCKQLTKTIKCKWDHFDRLNSFFVTITNSPNLFSCFSQFNVKDGKVQGMILNFSNRPSIHGKISTKQKTFSLQHISEATVRTVVKNVPR